MMSFWGTLAAPQPVSRSNASRKPTCPEEDADRTRRSCPDDQVGNVAGAYRLLWLSNEPMPR